MKWEKVEFNDVLEKIVGGGTPSKTIADYWNGDIPWCSVKDMVGDKYQLFSTEDTITKSGLENSSSNLILAGTVITSTRMGLGRAFINKVDMAINQDLKALIPNERIDNKFLLWTIVNKREEIEGLGIGSTVKGIRLEVLRGLKFNLPPLPTQRKIASILSAYDDLIENNLKRIKLLEEKAFLRYKQIVREEKMDSFFIEEVCETLGGGTPATGDRRFWDEGEILWFSPTDLTKHNSIVLLDSEKKITELGLQKSSAKLVPPKTILMTSRASIGYFGLINKPASTNQGFINIIPFNKNHSAYMLFDLKNRKEEIIGNANGSTFLEISKGKFRQMKINLPKDEKILVEFEKEFEIIFNMVENLLKQNTKLREARDILLPRLMSGEIEV